MPTLDWATREADLRAAEAVPYRLLDNVPGLGAGEGEASGLLVEGDNLDALKALLPFYGGRVRCIYIDPPYNTRSAFQHYDDNLEHAKWLGVIVPRLQLLREFLSEDGSIWVSIDDNEGHYLKVVMDEVFGRRNFVTSITWQQRTTRENRKVFSEDCERVMVFCQDPETFKSTRNKLAYAEAQRARYRNPDDDPRGPWQSVSLNAQAGHATNSQFYTFHAPSGATHELPDGRCWVRTWPEMQNLIDDDRIWFGANGGNVPRLKKFLSEADESLTPNTLWLAGEVGTNDEAKKETIDLFGTEVFDTPKPERLLQRILHIATNPSDLVLDSFLGSGTTAAVAHKMGRRWIGVEMGAHARTHAAARLRKVVDGEQGGISEDVGWQGGGAFRFATLGATAFDAEGRINPDVAWSDLAAHVWFAETRRAREAEQADGPLIGIHDGGAVALLWNGVLKDRSPSGGNVLVHPVLRMIREDIARRHPGFDGGLTVYGAATRLSPATLKRERITFKQTPYAVARRA